MAARKIVVVGNGMVGHHYVEQLLASGLELDITVLGAEPRPAYDRVHLSEFFAGRKPEEALRLGWAHGALLTTFVGDVTMARLPEVEALAQGGSARVQR